MSQKRPIGINVLEAARERIAWTFDVFPRIYISFSGGKDSTVMMHLVMAEAIKRDRKVGVLFLDLEGQYKLTIDHVQAMYDQYADHIEPFWCCLPIHLRNAVSSFDSHWVCWDAAQREKWIRELPPNCISDEDYFPFFRHAMEFEEFVPEFGKWYAQDKLCACFVGIRSDESLNRYRTIAGHGMKWRGRNYCQYIAQTLWNVYPVYDWKVDDLWIYTGKYQKSYNKLYDLMHKAGLTLSQMRICQPYGDDQRRGLWLFHLIEPETWARVVARVNGANMGALYVQESGNIMGYRNITKPEGHTWESFARMLMESLPPRMKEHYENKIAVFLHWWAVKGYKDGIPDEADPVEEADKKVPSWRRICKTLLRNDYWCKSLSFSMHKSEAYGRYQRIMKKRREQWGL